MQEQWYAEDVEQVFKTLQVDQHGLSDEQVIERRQQYGLNTLDQLKKKSALRRFIQQFHNSLIYVLVGAGLVTLFFEHWVDAGVIFAVVLINALIGYIQEGKAEKALDAIRKMLSSTAHVIRSGRKVELETELLVPGDIVFLQSGYKVPADLRLIKVKNLQIDESILTGESVPTGKQHEPVSGSSQVGDQKSMAFSATLVTAGQATGVVVATGEQTELGKINQLLRSVEQTETPLTRQMTEFGRILTFAILFVSLGTFLFGVYIHDYSVSEMFAAAIGIAVAAIPEGLPAILTITLAVGVQRMAGRRAIIRQMAAVDTLGSTTVICSDKTGTLTRNEMTVRHVVTRQQTYEVHGIGYSPKGDIFAEGKQVEKGSNMVLDVLARVALLCNDSSLEQHSEGWNVVGDPTEGALLTFVQKLGFEPSVDQNEAPLIDKIPFESEHRYMATLNQQSRAHFKHLVSSENCSKIVCLKGAPEQVLSMCHQQAVVLDNGELSAVDIDHTYWDEALKTFAAKGERVLAFAFKPEAEQTMELNKNSFSEAMILLGVVGMIDPPRTEAVEAIKLCRGAGIKVKMITGDHLLTARAIGEQLGIEASGLAKTGQDLDQIDDDELRQIAVETNIFARVNPEHKLRLVAAVQAQGEVVAMTGDGVNDAPALKRADIGIAMGMKGTEVTKDAADMVLADDNFASITAAVEEGRAVYDNMRKSILFILPTNGAEALTIMVAVIMGRTLPITPVQILWINMVTAVTLSLALAFEKPEQDIMQRRPRDPKTKLLTRFFFWRVIFVSVIASAATYGAFVWMRELGMDLPVARTVAINTLVMFEVFYLFNTRYIEKSAISRSGLFDNPYIMLSVALVIFLQLIFTYLPLSHFLFASAPISAWQWGLCITLGFLIFIIVELEKMLCRRMRLF